MEITSEGNNIVRIRYVDTTTAFGGVKQAVLKNKGKYSNRISAIAFQALQEAGIPTHFISLASDREQLCTRVEPIPIQFIVRNRLSGSTAVRLGLEAGTRIPCPVYEMRYLRKGSTIDPIIGDSHAIAIGLASEEDIRIMHRLVNEANDTLKELFHKAGIELIDMKLEFGRDADGNLLVCSGISPDNCRLWDESDGRVLDKDRFRHDMSDVCSAYKEVMERLIKVSEQ